MGEESPPPDWHYDSAADLDKSLLDRLANFPREPDMSVYLLRSAAALLLRGWLRVYHRLEVRGREHIPRDRSCVVVANHASHLDTLAILSAFPLKRLHRVFPAAAADYFFRNAHRTAVSAIVVNGLPFHRKARSTDSLAICRNLLENSTNVLVIFPEGTRTTDGEMKAFKLGVPRLVNGTDMPVVPCCINGAYRAWPKGAALPRPRKLKITFGPPLQFDVAGDDRDSLLASAERMRQAVFDAGPRD